VNYRHAYHAGNFADVLKHAVLALAIEHLKGKDAPFRVLDTHAGSGRYDLGARPAELTGEWRRGIGRLWGPEAPPLPAEAAAPLSTYLDAIAALNPDDRLRWYPGSPMLAAALLRGQDRLTACELHPEHAESLRALLARDKRAKVLALDGWLALGAFLPPKERRGLVLVDPPFEQPGEFERLGRGLLEAVRRWPGGTYLVWYPLKDTPQVATFLAMVAGGGVPKALRVEFWTRSPGDAPGLAGAALLVVNPPFRLEEQLRLLGPLLVERLGQGGGARLEVDWPVPEQGKAGRFTASAT